MPYFHQDGEFKYEQEEEDKKIKSKAIDSQSNLPQQPPKQYHGGYPTEKKQTNQYQPFLNQIDERILRQCYSEAFYKRCLPLTAISAIVVNSLLKKKILTSPFLSYSSACFTSYVIGTLSYRETTIKRIIESSSDSPFAKGLRERKGYRSVPSDREVKTMEQQESAFSQDMWQDKEFVSSPTQSEPTMFNDLPSEEEKNPKNYTTYDELRSKNRASFKF